MAQGHTVEPHEPGFDMLGYSHGPMIKYIGVAHKHSMVMRYLKMQITTIKSLLRYITSPCFLPTSRQVRCKYSMNVQGHRFEGPLQHLKKMKSRWLWNVATWRLLKLGSWWKRDASMRPTRCPSRVSKLLSTSSGFALAALPCPCTTHTTHYTPMAQLGASISG
jgi:hypothetical protein